MRKTMMLVASILVLALLSSEQVWAQLSSVHGSWSLRPIDWGKHSWELSVGTLFHQVWGENLGQSYLRMNIGLIANLKGQYFQELQLFGYLALGWEWSLSIPLARHLRISGLSHEVGIRLRDLGGKPVWMIEFLPFTVSFDTDGWFDQGKLPPQSLNSFELPNPSLDSIAQQPSSVDLKALVLARLDDLLKASEQLAKEKPVLDPATFREPLNEAKKSFEAGKIPEAIVQLNSYSMVLRALRKFLPDTMTEFDEAYLRSGFHRVADALALYTERAQGKSTKVCTGLYIGADKKEEVIGQFLNEAPKTASFGAKGTFTLKESRCF